MHIDKVNKIRIQINLLQDSKERSKSKWLIKILMKYLNVLFVLEKFKMLFYVPHAQNYAAEIVLENG